MEQILFTRQRHEADRAGLHWDYRLVVGGRALSWATKKEMPSPGKSIILYQQPDHSVSYALSKRIVIPKGNYGSGITTLDWVRKAELDKKDDHMIITTHDGDRFLLKQVPGYSEKSWLFKNLGKNPLDKSAEALGDHQQRALKKLDETGGVVLDHSMGSGKTRTFLTAIAKAQKENPNGNALIIAPASLVSNVDKEIEKHKIKVDRNRLLALSYEKATNMAKELRKKDWDVVVNDEGHKLRNEETKRHKELEKIITNARKRIISTGTTTYNHASDIAPLVNLAAGAKILPTGKGFENRYIQKDKELPPIMKRILGAPAKEVQKLKNKKELDDILNSYVDRYEAREDPKMRDKFPSKKEKVISVEMSPTQHTLYKFLENKLPWHLRLKVRLNVPLTPREASQLNAFSSGIRQISNTHRSLLSNSIEPSPKMVKAVENLMNKYQKDENFRGVVYSNYLESGLHEYSKELSEVGVPHAVFHGGLKASEKDAIIKDYNEGKIPVVLLSSSGSEGINLKGTKLIQILEPHFNNSKIDQTVARGIRLGSHEHLPKKERVVEVEHYHSVFPAGKMGSSIDEYLYHNSKTKEGVSNEMKSLIKSAQAAWRTQAIRSKLQAMAEELSAIPSGAFNRGYINKYLHKIINFRQTHPEIVRPYARLSFAKDGARSLGPVYTNPSFYRPLKSGEAGW